MKPFYLFIFSFSIILFSSCRIGFELDDLQPGVANSHKLPKLDFNIDGLSFRYAFPVSHTTNEDPDDPDSTPTYISTTDVKFHDTKILGERMIRDNVCIDKGPTYGSVTCKVIARDTRGKGVFFTVLSFATMSASNLIGLPYIKRETIVELEMEIFDSQGKSLGLYNGQGKSKMWVGFYYGTSDSDRVTNIEAVKQAFDRIQTRIYQDYSYLKQELLIAGPRGSY